MEIKYKILIADDDPSIVRKLGDIFLENDYIVVKVDNGKDALEKISSEFFHIAIIDIGMPDIDGLIICKEIRNKEDMKGIPIILISAGNHLGNRLNSYKAGADIFIKKPIIKEEILIIAKNLIKQKYNIEIALSIFDGYAGKIQSFPVVDILQFIELGLKTGAIELKNKGKSAIVFFDNGTIIHAESGRLKGSNAIYHIISWQEGFFVFTPDGKPKEITVRETLSHLLMEGIRLIDEERRDNIEVTELTNALLNIERKTEYSEKKITKKIEELVKHFSNSNKKTFEILIIDMWIDDRKLLLDFFINGLKKYINRVVPISKKHSSISSFARVNISNNITIELVVSSGKRKFNLLWQVFLEQTNALILFIDPRNENKKKDGIELCNKINIIKSNIPSCVISPVGMNVSDIKLNSLKWFAVPEYDMVKVDQILKYIFDYTKEDLINEAELRR